MSMLGDAYTIWQKEMQIWAKTPVVNLARAFMMPILWLVIFGNVFGGSASNVPIALVMEDNGYYAQTFAHALTEGNTLKIAANTNYEDALNLLDNRKVTAVVFIPPTFSDEIKAGEPAKVQVSIDSTTPLLSGAVEGALARAKATFAAGIAAAQNAGADGAPQAGAFAGGMGLILDRELGTLKMLMAAPIDKMSIVLGKITSGVTQSLVSGGIALLIAMVIGVQVKTGILGIFLVFGVLTLVAFGFIGMTVALAARIRSLESFMMAVQTIVMPIWFLSGSLYPIETIPAWLKPIALVNPLTYATEAVRSLMIRGVIWSTFVFDIAVLVVFSAIMVFIGTRAFKRTLE
ncbi:MAG: ABC transporter permease [Candidatus Micrarchaeota archaeon]|nr:ABC transporter permease [Candidatus Micrarchaeota archaeon]